MKQNEYIGIENNTDGSRMTNFELIVRLSDRMNKMEYKKNWLYCQFIQSAQFEITQKDFDRLAKILGYNDGWSWYKYNDYRKDLKKIQLNDQERNKRYARDNRYSNELETNKSF